MDGGRVPDLEALFQRASFQQPEGCCSLHILNPKRRYGEFSGQILYFAQDVTAKKW
jgi:hypothetical protein